MLATNLIKRSLAALGLVLLAAPALAGTTWRSWALNTSGCNPLDSAHPCAMEEDIVRAMSGVATQSNWMTKLDQVGNFNAWANKGSNNLPVLAGAIALWKGTPIGGQPPQNWWITFLTCQTAGDTCTIPLPNNVRYFNGYEILSPIYNAPAVSAVVAVRYWAALHNPTLFNLATTYLKMTSALYTLGAGTGPAQTALTYSFTKTSPPGVCPGTFTAAQTSVGCDTGGGGGTLYNGPFLALAGGRSHSTTCASSSGDGDREPLFVRAVQWPGVNHSMETREQEDLLDYVEINWPSIQTTNPYGNDASRRALLRNHVNGVPYDPSTIVQILQGARFIREYRFLTWPGVRVTVLSSNPDNCGQDCTAALFALKYDASTAQSTSLYPWPGDLRKEITQGYGRLMPSNSAPTSVVARNIDPALGETATCQHGDTTLSMPLPAGAPLFQVVLEPNANASIQ
jgi:hypothetical protein